MDSLIAFGQSLIGMAFDLNERISALYIVSAIAVAFVLWLLRGQSRPFVQWLVPREVYTHRSNLMDIKLLLTNKLCSFAGVTGAVFFPPIIAYSVVRLLSGQNFEPGVKAEVTLLTTVFVTVIVVMASDFSKYWAHRWHHEIKALWPFHSVHHSADVLTPLTVMRSHPVESMIRNLLITAILGLVQGVMLFLLVGEVGIVAIGGANALYFLFNAVGSNLRHSHIWLSYGRVLEHVFISPAQHQIHHSMAKEHHDKNYGSMFALWDWMFGTLYVPAKQETLTFGISDADGTPLPQPHETLSAALVLPFRECWTALTSRDGAGSDDAAPTKGETAR